jgi:hypothetical protein
MTPPVSIFFSQSKEESARIIWDLAEHEAKQNQPIMIPDIFPEKKNQV